MLGKTGRDLERDDAAAGGAEDDGLGVAEGFDDGDDVARLLDGVEGARGCDRAGAVAAAVEGADLEARGERGDGAVEARAVAAAAGDEDEKSAGALVPGVEVAVFVGDGEIGWLERDGIHCIFRCEWVLGLVRGVGKSQTKFDSGGSRAIFMSSHLQMKRFDTS